jgi:hypothetical protein
MSLTRLFSPSMIQKKATQVLFRKSGFNMNTAIAVKFGPPKLCGIGFRRLYTKQSVLQQCMILKHLRTPGQPQHLYCICLAWAQLASGVGLPLLEFPELRVPTLEDEFLQSIRRGMVHTGSSLRLHLSLVRPLARADGFYIMEGLFALDELTPAEANREKYCRIFVGAYLASDIVSPDGMTILPEFFKGHLAQRANKPMVMLPRQARPDAKSWKQWRRALRLLFTKPRCTALTLLEPLGSWYPPRHDSHTWRAYKSGSKLIIRTGFTSVLTEYSSTVQRRRHQQYLKTTARIIPKLPEQSVPIELPSQSRHH